MGVAATTAAGQHLRDRSAIPISAGENGYMGRPLKNHPRKGCMAWPGDPGNMCQSDHDAMAEVAALAAQNKRKATPHGQASDSHAALRGLSNPRSHAWPSHSNPISPSSCRNDKAPPRAGLLLYIPRPTSQAMRRIQSDLRRNAAQPWQGVLECLVRGILRLIVAVMMIMLPCRIRLTFVRGGPSRSTEELTRHVLPTAFHRPMRKGRRPRDDDPRQPA